MKKIYLLFFVGIALYFTSCTSEKDKKIDAIVNAESQVDELIQKQKNNKPVKKIIFTMNLE